MPFILAGDMILKMDLGVGEMEFIFCCKHPLLMTRIQVSNPGPCALLLLACGFISIPLNISYMINIFFESLICLKLALDRNLTTGGHISDIRRSKNASVFLVFSLKCIKYIYYYNFKLYFVGIH